MNILTQLELELTHEEHAEIIEAVVKAMAGFCKEKGSFDLEKLSNSDVKDLGATMVQVILTKVFQGHMQVAPPF